MTASLAATPFASRARRENPQTEDTTPPTSEMGSLTLTIHQEGDGSRWTGVLFSMHLNRATAHARVSGTLSAGFSNVDSRHRPAGTCFFVGPTQVFENVTVAARAHSALYLHVNSPPHAVAGAIFFEEDVTADRQLVISSPVTAAMVRLLTF